MGMANATHSAAPWISLRRQPRTTISTNSRAGRMRIWPTWANGALQPEHQPAGHDQPWPGPGPPEQQGQPGHDAGLEPHVGHDGLLDLQLVAVQQHRRRGQRGQPARHAAAAQHQVQGQPHGQAEQVLDGHHRFQVPGQQQPLEDHVVAERVVARPGAVQVLEAVDVQQRGPVGDLGQHTQHQAGQQQRRDQPVRRATAPAASRPARAPAGRQRSALAAGRGITRIARSRRGALRSLAFASRSSR